MARISMMIDGDPEIDCKIRFLNLDTGESYPSRYDSLRYEEWGGVSMYPKDFKDLLQVCGCEVFENDMTADKPGIICVHRLSKA